MALHRLVELYIYWIVQIGSGLGIVSFNYALLKYYTDPHETVKVTLFIQVFAFSSVMVYLLLIPFDVFATVRHYKSIFSIKEPIWGTTYSITVYDLYFLSYICMIYLCFIGLPYSYFYAQSVQEEEEILNEETVG